MPQSEHNHPVLPRLRDDSQVKSFGVAGQWQAREASELEKLSKGLAVERLEFEINSIPDMWARPLLFEMALYDSSDPNHGIPGHLLHSTVVGEWRGLLALLALRELRGIDALSTVRVQIPQAISRRDQRTDSDSRISEPCGFLDTLAKLVPSKTLASDTSWRDLYVFLFDGKPIGMTSPTTLVCTATDYFGRVHNVPWFDGQNFEDPTSKLSRSEKLALAGWLRKLKDNLLLHDDLNQDLDEWEQIQGRIEGFIEDLGGPPESAAELGDIGLEMTAGVFTYLNLAVRAEEGVAERSHVRLLPSRQPAPQTTILIVDERIAEQWRTPPQSILVWGTIPLEAVTRPGALSSRRNKIGNKTVEGIQTWKSEEFFTDKLFVMDQENAFPGTLKPRILGTGTLVNPTGQPITPILPIKKELVDYLRADDLVDRISFQQADGAIKVRLELPLSGLDGQGETYVVTRVYHFRESQIQGIDSAPVLEIWPNFVVRNAEWRTYYTYYSAAGISNTFYAEPYCPGLQPPKVPAMNPQTFKNSRGGIDRRISRTTQFPEAMLCEAQVANQETKRSEKYYAGLLLMDGPPQISLQNKEFKVGIDFGASNTHLYAKDGGTNPAPLIFANRFLRVTDSGDRRAILYKDFLPGEPEPTPFLSLFHDFLQTDGSQNLRPLLDGHIYFFRHYGDFDALSEGMRSDLKWSQDPGDRSRAATFLQQLCLQASAEAVASGANRIKWAFSYPTAFPKKRIQDFGSTWSGVIQTISSLTGIANSSATPESKTESVASALFFKELLSANVATGAVCIDIGGSTSDLAIWRGQSLQWQSSIRFAGRDMFLNLLRANPSFLSLFVSDVSSLNRSNSNRTAFYAQADALMAREGDRIFELLRNYSETPQVKEFTQLIALGLAGLFYYVGSVLRFLKLTEKDNGGLPDFYVGGNGARLFHWLASGEYTSSSGINDLFKSVLVRATGFGEAAHFSVNISPHPKAEAAYGLVSELRLGTNDRADQAENEVVAGEVFVENGVNKGWSELIDDKKLFSGLSVPEELERLTDFLDSFDHYAHTRDAEVSPISADRPLMDAIRKRLIGALSDYKLNDEASVIAVEPIFILALKCLMEIKTKQVYRG